MQLLSLEAQLWLEFLNFLSFSSSDSKFTPFYWLYANNLKLCSMKRQFFPKASCHCKYHMRLTAIIFIGAIGTIPSAIASAIHCKAVACITLKHRLWATALVCWLEITWSIKASRLLWDTIERKGLMH